MICLGRGWGWPGDYSRGIRGGKNRGEGLIGIVSLGTVWILAVWIFWAAYGVGVYVCVEVKLHRKTRGCECECGWGGRGDKAGDQVRS